MPLILTYNMEGSIMKKRLLALTVACLSLALITSGCSSTTDEPQGTATSTAATGDTIKVGGLAPLTGNLSIYGIATNNGVKLAIDEINAAGGVLGKQLEYVVYDEKGDSTEAVNAYNKLVQNDGIVALIGDVTSTPSIAVAQQAAIDGIPMITATGTAADITKAGKNVFRVCFIDPYQGEVMASYANKKLNAKKAAILYNTSDDYSIGLTNSFEATAADLGLEIVAKEGYTKGDVDFNSQLTKIAAANADVVFIPVYYEDAALIAVQAKAAGIDATLLGADGWDGIVDKISDASAIKNAYFCCGYSAENDNENLQAFITKYTDTYGEAPKGFSAQGYDAAYLLAQAIKEAGSTDSAAVVEALTKINYEGITGKIVFDENRNPIKGVVINTFKDGAVKFVENYEK